MSAEDFRGKFEGLVSPVLGEHTTGELYALLNEFERPGNFSRVMALLARNRRAETGP